MFTTFLVSVAAAVASTGPAVPAADSPVRSYGGTVVFSSYDLTRDAYRLTVERGGRTKPLAVPPSATPFDADVGPGRDDTPRVVFARDGIVFDETGARVGRGRAPSIWRGQVAAVRGDDVVVGERVVARVAGVTELELRGRDLAVVSARGVRVVGTHARDVAAAGARGVSFADGFVGWYTRSGAHRVDLRSGGRDRARGPRDVSGFALLPGDRALWVEPEGEDARLRRLRLSWRAG